MLFNGGAGVFDHIRLEFQINVGRKFLTSFYKKLTHYKSIRQALPGSFMNSTNMLLNPLRPLLISKIGFSIHKNNVNADLREAIKTFDDIQEIYKSDLHHYFRFIYRVIKFVKESDIEESQKYSYTSMFRAMFNPYELALIFYNGLHNNGKDKFKPLLEEYSFLKNLDISLLLNSSHLAAYHPIALPRKNNIKRSDLLYGWENQHYNVSQTRR